jgi:oxepin-CoA hydrolase/3-oxo-5,6-dehydrosuberyl-CoA semialdehyde dehydrogenase
MLRAMLTLPCYLNDRWVTGEGPATTLVNPTTEEPVARASTAGLDLAGAVRHARATGGPALRAMTFAERGALLGRMSKVIQTHRDALIEASILNAGTTRGDAKFDVDGASGTLWVYAKLGETLGARRVLADGDIVQLGRTPRFAGGHLLVPRRGVAVHVNAFNFPAWGLAEKAACALLAGMPVITKPGTSTALTAFKLFEALVNEADLPSGALQLVAGPAGDLLAHLGDQDVLGFTGGGATGQHLKSLEHLVAAGVRVNVEADSLNAAVFGPDVDPTGDTFALAVKDVVLDVRQKTGQKCTAIRRVLVPEPLADAVCEALAADLAAVRVGDPADSATDMGPLATAAQLRDVTEGVAALAADARIVWGAAERPAGAPPRGWFVSPVLLRADPGAAAPAVHGREVFGPVATVVPYRDAADMATLVARGAGGLVASLYSDDRDFLERAVFDLAPWHGRLYVANGKVAEHGTRPGTVLPQLVHGGPGRAGGGEELGGERGLRFYLQRTAVQGPRGLLDRWLGAPGGGAESA